MSRAANSNQTYPDLLAGVQRLCGRTHFFARLRRAFLIFWMPLIIVALLAAIATAIAQVPGRLIGILRDALINGAEEQPILTILGGLVALLVALVLMWVIPYWIKAYYRYHTEVERFVSQQRTLPKSSKSKSH